MRWDLEDPAPHQVFFYNQAIEDLAEELGYEPEENDLIPDGGIAEHSTLQDEFGRTLEEQLIDQIAWNYLVDSDLHSIHEEYSCDDKYQDGDEDLPFGFHVTYNGGPELEIEEPYLAPWHRDHAIEVLEEDGYDELIKKWE